MTLALIEGALGEAKPVTVPLNIYGHTTQSVPIAPADDSVDTNRVIFNGSKVYDVTVSDLGIGPKWNVTKEVVWTPQSPHKINLKNTPTLVLLGSYTGTSVTSFAVGTGSKVFITQSGLSYVVGARVRATSTGMPSAWMEGLVTAYSGTNLTINIDTVNGTGTHADWSLGGNRIITNKSLGKYRWDFLANIWTEEYFVDTTSVGMTGGAGPPGPPGPGVPVGGTIGQVLAKNSATDYDTHWITPAGGGGTPGGTTGQIQFNSSGTFGGFTVGGDGTLNTTTGALVVTRTNGTLFAPSATTDTTNAANISSGTLPAARLPNPSATTLGGVQSVGPVAHQWIASISTAGVPSLSQPTYADIGGTFPGITAVPPPTTSTLGGLFSNAGAAHQWVAAITTTGAVTLTQPAFTDISGTLSTSQLPSGVITSDAPSDGHSYGRLNATWSQVLPIAGGTLTGNLTIAPSVSTSEAFLTLNKPVGERNTIYGQTAGSNRWIMVFGNFNAESGSNVGSDFVLQRCNDTGGTIDSPLTITRSSGDINFGGAGNVWLVRDPISGLQAATKQYVDNHPASAAQMPAYTGDVTSPAGSTVNTLATVNTNIGTFQGITVNGKGLVTAATNMGYLTGNQTVTLSGDVTGSGATAITATLATVNTTTGTFQGLTVNGKGLVTNAVNMNYLTGNQTVTLSGDVTGSGATAITATLATVNSNVGTFQGITVNGKGLVTAAANMGYLTAVPPPTASVLGGVFSNGGGTHQWVASITTSGTVILTQPSFADISGTAAASQLPVFVASGASHAQGVVPDPGATAGTSRFLCENATWAVPGSGSAWPGEAPSDGTVYGRMNATWTQAVKLAGDTMTGNLGISVANPALTLYKNSTERTAIICYNRSNGFRRWVMNIGNSTAESGSNAGSDFLLQAFDDSGNALSAPLTITRSNGQVTFGGPTAPMHQPPAGNHAAYSLNKPSSGYLSYIQGLTGGVPRWTMYLGDNSSESGGNVGSDFALFRFNDGGATIDAPITVSRSTGKVALNGAPVAPILPKFLAGLTLSNDATSPLTVLDIDAGSACSDDNTTMMALLSAYTKNCNAAWAVGSGNGALDSGSTLAASTWYHVYLIERTDTYVVDVLISTSATAPTMPSGYTKKRRIGSIRTNASAQILAFTQYGDQFLWTATVVDYSNITLSTGINPVATLVPTGVKVIAIICLLLSNTSGGAWGITALPYDQTLAGANNPGGNLTIYAYQNGTFASDELHIRTNTNTNFQVASTGTVGGYYQICRGWFDNRGK